MDTVDLLVLVWVVASAALGARRGLAANLLSLGGFFAGAVIGSRIAPHLLTGGAGSSWVPAAGLIGAMAGGFIVQALAGTVGSAVRRKLLRGPLRVLDTAGGAVAGIAFGLALTWLAATVALEQPALGLRNDVRESSFLPALLREVPPTSVLNLLSSVDPLPIIPAIADRMLPPGSSAVLRSPAVLADKSRVVKVEGTACAIGIQGSGWVIGRNLVATNAHVIAGENSTEVLVSGRPSLAATVVAISATNDVAILRVPGLDLSPLRMAGHDPSGQSVALIGYPEDGPLQMATGRAGAPITALSQGAFGGRSVWRTIVPLRGSILHGDSGGPVIDAAGQVVAMMFATDSQGGGGYGVPLAAIRAALHSPFGHVPATPCPN